MRLISKLASASLLAVVAAGCRGDILSVDNLSNPDVEKVFATPASIESTIGSGFQGCHNAIITSNLQPQILTSSLESYSALNNFAMGVRVSIPRSPIQNSRGSASIFNDFSSLQRGARLSGNAVDALDRLTASGKSLGSKAQDLRARAFGFFVVGCNQGWVSVVYDSAGIVHPGLESDFVPDLSHAQDVMDDAIKMLDSAIAIASDPAASGTGGFPLPAAWINGNAMSTANFIRFVRSYRARFRADVARTPAERNALNWDLIIADAEAGITADVLVTSSSTTGWNTGFTAGTIFQESVWGAPSPHYYGMADVSGGYDAWLAQPINVRTPFLMITPDKRWPQGATRALQQANSSAEPTTINSHPYFRNRTLQDPSADPWGDWLYDPLRLKYIRLSTAPQPYPDFLVVENDMLAAEGHIRKGTAADVVKAAALIDKSRVASGGLPALTGVVTTTTGQVPGGAGCVPRVPAAPAFTSTACGTIMEAMKWEKRMELAFTGYSLWMWDSRGWGDLVEGTPYEWPVPYQDMDARYHGSQLGYNLGGGLTSSAAKGTYGF